MIISAKYIPSTKPTSDHRCSACGLRLTGSKLRIFGSPDIGQVKPYSIYYCIECAKNVNIIKINKVINAIKPSKLPPATIKYISDRAAYWKRNEALGKGGYHEQHLNLLRTKWNDYE